MANYHGGCPAVNIKCYKGVFDAPLPLDLGRYSEDGGETWIDQKTDPEYTHDWIAKNMSDEDLMNWWGIVAEDVVGHLIENGKDLFQEAGYDVEIYSAGCSGGWLEVHGLEDGDWSKDLIKTWKEFESYCEDAVYYFPISLSTDIYCGVFEVKKAEKVEKEKQVKAIWDEVHKALDTVIDLYYQGVDLPAFMAACPLLTAQVEVIKE